MSLRFQHRRPDSGYIMMTLLLTMALAAIFAGIIVSSITFDIKRDREEEMIHRGVQYSRAVRAYYKKFNRYPAKIEDLENTNQMRFLRKRYKDPLTGKDFKLLHYGEAKMSMNTMGAGMVAAAAMAGQNGALGGPGGPGQGQPFGQGLNTMVSGAIGQAVAANMAAAQVSAQNPAGGSSATPDSQDSSQGNGPGSPNGTSTGAGSLNGNSGDKLSGTTFGGAPIVGVASTSKDKTIREFDKKKKYDEWQFVYDPTFDRGFLITTPYQPQLQLQLQGLGAQGNINGLNPNGQNGTSSFGNGPGNTFGNPPSQMQNTPMSPTPGGYGNASPPPQQQQQ
jgi:type II secretory pathway pseudopilin PulG